MENADARAAERAHAKEVKRLSRPLGKIKVQVDYVLNTESTNTHSTDLKRIIKWTAEHISVSPVFDRDFPGDLRGYLPSRGSMSASIGVEFYRKRFPCPKIASLDREPDLLVETQKGTSGWQYFAEHNSDYLFATRSFEGSVVRDTRLITSVEDIPDSTIMLWSDAFADQTLKFQSVDLSVASGVRFTLSGAPNYEIKSENGTRGYCYNLPNQ